MQKITVGILAKLTKDGAKDISLLVHSYYLGRPSPCVVIEDGLGLGLTGGHIESIEQIFQIVVSNHPGYIVRESMTLEMKRPESVGGTERLDTEDYVISRTGSGEYGVTAQTERAEDRKPGGFKIGHTLCFRSRDEVREYVEVAETEGLTFAGKVLLR